MHGLLLVSDHNGRSSANNTEEGSEYLNVGLLLCSQGSHKSEGSDLFSIANSYEGSYLPVVP